MTLSLTVNAAPREPKKSDFLDWDYAVWAWTNLKTEAQLDAEWEKREKAYEAWADRYKQDPWEAMEYLETSPEAADIKKHQSLMMAWNFWKYFVESREPYYWAAMEPDCYVGKPAQMMFEIRPFPDYWLRWNIFTGKCDWPNWASADIRKYLDKQKAEFMADLKRRQERQSGGKH